jgi:uncharacterized protein (DUF3820 family)
MDDSDPILPFGKHKGERCSDVPVGYLDWLIGQDWLKPDLKQEIENHLETRTEWRRMNDDD